MKFRRKFASAPSCRDGSLEQADTVKRVALVGNPNVGKSVIFNALTGIYVTVSNYPGTTVDVSRGRCKIKDKIVEIIDTPGMYSLLPITEEERIGKLILLTEHIDLIIHIIDAKNIERMLSFTLQLIETGIPVILVLNIMDEAERMGMSFDIDTLEERLHIPVVPTVGTSGKGISRLKDRIYDHV